MRFFSQRMVIIHYFNSTMVRLKVLPARRLGMYIKYFNSTMVRLKDFSPYGGNMCCLDFNSTMVRLKAFGTFYLSQSDIFQFHYGTIKSAYVQKGAINYVNFNSTMVRLKASH